MKGSDFYYDRQTLYEEVWTKPVYKVAQRYGVSNVPCMGFASGIGRIRILKRLKQ